MYAFAHPNDIILSYLVKKQYGSPLQRNVKRRGGKREGAGRKKSPALTKITTEITQKHWRVNHHYIDLENRIFSTWKMARAEGIFIEDSNFASWLLVLELRLRQASVHSRLSPRQGQALVEPCFLQVEQAFLQ